MGNFNFPTSAFAGTFGLAKKPSWISNLLSNKMFQQYLAAAGADIMGNQPGTNLAGAVQQNIASQNYMRLLARILGGDVPDGSKMTIDGKGMKIDIAKPMQEAGGSYDTSGGFYRDPVSGNVMYDPSLATGGKPASSLKQVGAVNPFVSSQPGISASDLAGLSPQDISQALQFKFTQEELGRRSVADVLDAIYKGAVLERETAEGESRMAYEQALSNESIARALAMTPQYQIPGTDILLTRDEALKWMMTTPEDDRTAEIKNFQFAQTPEGGGFTGSFVDFTDPQTTAQWKNYTLAGGRKGTGKSFNDWLLQQAEAGATRVGLPEKLRELEAVDKLGARSIFRGDWTKEIDKIDAYSSDAWIMSQRYIKEGMNQTEAIAKAEIDAKLGAVRRKIEAAGGEIVGREMEGNTYIYVVRWSEIKDSQGNVLMPASTERIRYASK